MRLVVYSVYDVAVGAFMPPFFLTANGQAMRNFGDAVADPQSPLSKHPGDYKLMRLAEWDDSSGAFISEGNPVQLCTGSDFVSAPASVSEGLRDFPAREVARRG